LKDVTLELQSRKQEMAVVKDTTIDRMKLKDQREPSLCWRFAANLAQEPAVSSVSQNLLDAADFARESMSTRTLVVLVRLC
jgi:hypothetical protein